MNKFGKMMTGAAAAALVTLTAAAPAQAQYRDYDRYDRDSGIDVGDIVTGVAIAGAAAVAIGAITNAVRGDNYGYGNYGYGNRNYGYGNQSYGYGNRYDNPNAAVNVCAREAQRYGQRVEIRDVDRDNGYYKVKGRVEVRDYNRGWNRGYDIDRENFTCYAANGRIYDFRI